MADKRFIHVRLSDEIIDRWNNFCDSKTKKTGHKKKALVIMALNEFMDRYQKSELKMTATIGIK